MKTIDFDRSDSHLLRAWGFMLILLSVGFQLIAHIMKGDAFDWLIYLILGLSSLSVTLFLVSGILDVIAWYEKR